MPLSIPSFIIVFLFEFQASWNNLQAALIYLSGTRTSSAPHSGGAENPSAACAWIAAVNSLESWTAAGDARGATREADRAINTGLFTGVPEADQQIRVQWVVPTDNADFDQVIATFYDILPTGDSPGASPAGQTTGQELNNAVTATLLGEKTAEEALADAQDAAMRAYEDAIAGG